MADELSVQALYASFDFVLLIGLWAKHGSMPRCLHHFFHFLFKLLTVMRLHNAARDRPREEGSGETHDSSEMGTSLDPETPTPTEVLYPTALTSSLFEEGEKEPDFEGDYFEDEGGRKSERKIDED